MEAQETFGKQVSSNEQQTKIEDRGSRSKRHKKIESDFIFSFDHRGGAGRSNVVSCERGIRNRTHFPPKAVEKLSQVFAQNELPSSAVKQKLSEQLGLPTSKINKWFEHKRRKTREEMFGKKLSQNEPQPKVEDKGPTEIEDKGPPRKRRKKKESDAFTDSIDRRNGAGCSNVVSNERSSRHRTHVFFPPDAVEKLCQVFAEDELPSRAVKERLSEELGFPTWKIRKWFEKKRRKTREIHNWFEREHHKTREGSAKTTHEGSSLEKIAAADKTSISAMNDDYGKVFLSSPIPRGGIPRLKRFKSRGPVSKIDVKTGVNTVSNRSASTSGDAYVEKELEAPRISEGNHIGRNASACSLRSKKKYYAISMKVGVEYVGKYSSSDSIVAELPGKIKSVKRLCISVQKRHGLLNRIIGPGAYCALDAMGAPAASSLPCKICGCFENSFKMLKCDLCEEAFHVSCSYTTKKHPRFEDQSEWYCQSCLKSPKLSEIRYKSKARIGKFYQAEVPKWSGPVFDDCNYFENPLKSDSADCVGLNNWNISKELSVCNWIQCRGKANEDNAHKEGSGCGKWRRAPLSEKQTDEWDCSCAVVWDPLHADCAVPQELVTSVVLMLKKQEKKTLGESSRMIPL